MNREFDDTELEAISASLDGADANGSFDRDAILADERLSLRFREYERVSEAVKSLPEPLVTAAFSARVMDAVRDIPVHNEVTRHRWPVGSLAAAAVLAIVAGVLYFMPATDPAIPESQARSFTDLDTAVLTATIASRLRDQPEDNGSYVPATLEITSANPLAWQSQTLENEAILGELESVVDDDSELEDLLTTLSDDEANVLKRMLIAYDLEG